MPTLDEFLRLAQPLAHQGSLALSALLVAAMLIFSDWRLVLLAFAGVEVLAGVLLIELLPPEWALLQWIVGGLMGVMWYLAARRVDTVRRRQMGVPWWRPDWRFNPSTYMRMALIILLLALLVLWRPTPTLPKLPADLARFAAFLALDGLLGLGLGDRPLRWGVSLALWILAVSFPIHALQVDAATVGLLGSLQILLGFAISYLIIVDGARFWIDPEDA